MTISKDELIESIKPLFKNQGFKKKNNNWYKNTKDLIFIFNLQGSQWAKEDYYINLGIFIKSLAVEATPPIYKCHIQTRLDNYMDIDSINMKTFKWFDEHDSIDKLKALHINNNFSLITAKAKEYFEGLL